MINKLFCLLFLITGFCVADDNLIFANDSIKIMSVDVNKLDQMLKVNYRVITKHTYNILPCRYDTTYYQDRFDLSALTNKLTYISDYKKTFKGKLIKAHIDTSYVPDKLLFEPDWNQLLRDIESGLK